MTFKKGQTAWNNGLKGAIHLTNRKDITGKRFGKLIAISLHSREPRKSGSFRYFWLFRCDCGKENVSERNSVTCGDVISCGCYLKILQKNAGERTKTHDMSDSRIYKIFKSIGRRCNKTSVKNYHNYGGRGIKCLWKTFEEFRDDMYESYQAHVIEFGEKNTTIERKNNEGHYCKDNCRWATYKEQARNTRSNHLITLNGETKCLEEWYEIIGNRHAREGRIRRGWSYEDAFLTPVAKYRYTIDKGGVTMVR